MNRYKVRDRQCGYIIDEFETIKEAEEKIL